MPTTYFFKAFLYFITKFNIMTRQGYPLNFRPTANRGDDYLQYAEMYKCTVEILLDVLLDDEEYNYKNLNGRVNSLNMHDYSVLPLLFNFRHYVELQLTGLIVYGSYVSDGLNKDLDAFLVGARKDHGLTRLFNRLRKLERSNGVWDKEIVNFLLTFDKYDLKADRFRYPENRKAEKYFTEQDKIYSDSKYKNFYQIISRPHILKNKILTVIDKLENLESFFEIMINNRDEDIEQMNYEYGEG